MSGHELFQELQMKTAKLDAALGELRSRGSAYAQAKHDYRVALSKEILMERKGGTPVTIILDVCRGKREIAKLCFDRDVAEQVYKSALEAINIYKLQVRVLQEQLDREWNRA